MVHENVTLLNEWGTRHQDIHNTAEAVAKQIFDRVFIPGVHPGHCAVLFNQRAKDVLFPPQEGGVKKFQDLVNEKLRGKSLKQPLHMLQLTQNISESLLPEEGNGGSCDLVANYQSTTSNETAEYHIEKHKKVTYLWIMMVKIFNQLQKGLY